MSEEEAAKPDNSKVEGQTVRAGMKVFMKDNRIESGAFQAGVIQGNGCQKLMSCRGEITKYMTDFLKYMPAGKKIAVTRLLVSFSGCTPSFWAIWRPYFEFSA